MVTPRTRAEFERNFNLLHKHIKDGKFHIAPGLERSLEGISQVRYLPNGRIDFLSVDESARLQANSISQFIGGGIFQDMIESDQNSNNSEESESENQN